MPLQLVFYDCGLETTACGYDFGLVSFLIVLGMRLRVCLDGCYLVVACCVCGWL